MTTVKQIDLKGLESEERERRLFGALEGLRTGGSLQVSLEFNPLPLAYTLRAGGEFRVEYLKEGPEEWILELTRAAQPAEKREQLKELLRQARQGPLSPEGQEQARGLLAVLDVATLALLERDLAREGLSQAEIRGLLRGLHLQVLGDSLASLGPEAAAAHPVHRLMEEHQAILATLDSLEQASRRLETAPSLESVRDQLERLRRAAGLLQETESHHRREEEVIFPRLVRLGIVEPPALMREDHERFRRRKQRLAALVALAEQAVRVERAAGADGLDFGLWRCETVDHAQHLVRELASHILKEDNVLYRAALKAFSAGDWEEVRGESDAIGYCRFDPEPAAPAVELDMRAIPLLQRQARILSAWRELPTGGLLRLINDREPRPLFYLFQATQRGRFGWRYEKAGPEEWIALIRKP
jgi:uncharacterized protein (DUF2249 family)/hemerythrin-like domain-containing protein